MSTIKDYYVYPAVLNFDEDGITIEFPDLPGCFSCALSTDEAVRKAREAMGLHLFNLEDDNDTIPEPSDIRSIHTDNNQAVILVDVSMPPVRERIRKKSMNKMCTVPAWLLTESAEAGINFSQTLQEALMEKLGIKHNTKRRKSSKHYTASV